MRRRRSPPTWWVSTKQSRLWIELKLNFAWIAFEINLSGLFEKRRFKNFLVFVQVIVKTKSEANSTGWYWLHNTGLQWGGPQNLEGCRPQGHHHGWGLQGKQQVLSWCESQWKFLRNLALMRTPQTLWDTHWLCSGRSFNIGYFYQFRSHLSTIFLPGMTTTWKSPAQRQWRGSSCTVTHWPDMVIKSESWEWAEILDTCFNFSLLNLSVMTICREVPLPLPPLWVGRTATGLCTLVRHLWRNLHAWQTHWRDCLRRREGEIEFRKKTRNLIWSDICTIMNI